MIVLGMDLSLTATGLVLMENGRVVDWSLIGTSAGTNDQERMDEIMMFACGTSLSADRVALEGTAFGASHSDSRPHELSGLVKWRLWKMEADVVLVSPSRLKKWATGNGRASKSDMAAAAVELGFEAGKNHNLADAFHLARYVESLA